MLGFSSFFSTVKRDVKSTDEEGLKLKEQSILELGTLLQQQVKCLI